MPPQLPSVSIRGFLSAARNGPDPPGHRWGRCRSCRCSRSGHCSAAAAPAAPEAARRFHLHAERRRPGMGGDDVNGCQCKRLPDGNHYFFHFLICTNRKSNHKSKHKFSHKSNQRLYKPLPKALLKIVTGTSQLCLARWFLLGRTSWSTFCWISWRICGECCSEPIKGIIRYRWIDAYITYMYKYKTKSVYMYISIYINHICIQVYQDCISQYIVTMLPLYNMFVIRYVYIYTHTYIQLFNQYKNNFAIKPYNALYNQDILW